MDAAPTRAHVITFTDLVYASLASYGLPLFDAALKRGDGWAVACLGMASVWMFYDWYANHFFAVEQHLGAKNIPFDAISFFQYAGLLYASALTSPWIFFFLAIRALRGIVYNELALRRGEGPRAAARLRSYNFSSGFMVLAYTPLFIWDVSCDIFDAGLRLGIAIAIWALAYAIAIFAEARFERRAARRARPGPPQPSAQAPPVAAAGRPASDGAEKREDHNPALWAALAFVLGLILAILRRRKL